MPEEGFSEVGAVVSLDGLDETISGMERYNAGIEGMAQETGKQAAQMGAHWERLSKDTRKSLEGTVGAVEKGGDVLGEMPTSYRRMKAELAGMGERAGVADKQIDALHSTVAAGVPATAAAGSGFSTLIMAVGAFVAVAGLAAGAVYAMHDALERMDPLWAARDAFAALGDQVGLTSSIIVRDTQRASRFTVSEYKIIIGANKDLLAGNEALAESYSDLMDLAYVVARTTGKGVEQQFDAIASAIRSGSQAALEAADVWIDVETAQRAYAATHDRRLDQLSEEELQLVALRVVLGEMPDYIDRMGGASESALTPIRELTTEIGLLKDEMLAAMGVGFLGFLESLGIDLPEAVRGLRETVVVGAEVAQLLKEIRLAAEEGLIGEELAQEAYSMYMQARRGVHTLEEVQRRYLEILGRRPPTPTDPYAGISEHERRVLSPGQLEARLGAMALEEERMERMTKERREAEETLIEQAREFALGLAPYLTDEELRAVYDRYIELGEEIIDQSGDIYGFEAQAEMRRMVHETDEFRSALAKLNKTGGRSVSWLKAMAEMRLGKGPVGEWAIQFTAEHGLRTPFEVYERHEEPLVAAMMDKMFAERMMREEGRPPTEEEYVAHWYAVHGPFEVFPGGPILGQRGPEWEAAKAELAGLGIEEVGKIWHTEWMARKGVLTSLDEMKTQEQLLADFLADTAIPAREDETEAVVAVTEKTGDLGKAMDAVLSMLEAHLDKPPPDGEGEEEELPPVPSELAREAGRLKKRTMPTGETLYLPIPVAPGESEEAWRGGPLQFGGISTRTQDVRVHEDEGIIPFGSPGVAAAILSQMLGRMGVNVGPPGQMGGSGISIGQINVPITVGGNVTRQTAAMLQATIVEGIRHRAGAAIRREARRLGR